MKADNRGTERIQRALEESRRAFDDVAYPMLDITNLSAADAAKNIIYRAFPTKARNMVTYN